MTIFVEYLGEDKIRKFVTLFVSARHYTLFVCLRSIGLLIVALVGYHNVDIEFLGWIPCATHECYRAIRLFATETDSL